MFVFIIASRSAFFRFAAGSRKKIVKVFPVCVPNIEKYCSNMYRYYHTYSQSKKLGN